MGMGSENWNKLWAYVTDLQDQVARPEIVPHEETELHRVFCDDHFCLERDGEGCE